MNSYRTKLLDSLKPGNLYHVTENKFPTSNSIKYIGVYIGRFGGKVRFLINESIKDFRTDYIEFEWTYKDYFDG